ncbi:MAG: type VI secretion protein IcmF/TssM N-terminal domain-containing protein [Janthinobacterium lividum]
MKRLLIALAWVFGLLALALVCWIATWRVAWPLWLAPLLFLGALLTLWLSRLSWRAWRRWRAARALRRGDAVPPASPLADLLARDWETGSAALGSSQLSAAGWLFRRARRARRARAARALPCLLMLGEHGSGKSTLLARTRLTSSLRPVRQDLPIAPTAALNWWFFDRSVVLDPAGALADPNHPEHDAGAWRMLLRRLVKLRGKHALNGIVLTLPAPCLLAARDDAGAGQALADAGLALRAQVDQVCAAFGARVPVHVVITQADRLPGFSAWAEALDGATRAQPVGLLADHGEALDAFLSRTFTRLGERFADLRLLDEQLPAYRPGDSFFIGTRIAALQAPLQRFLMPAFTHNPYGGVPHLCGLFFSASVPGAGWFTRELFDRLLPAGLPQNAARPVLPYRRALYAWYAFNGACAALLGAGWIDLHGSLSTLQGAAAIAPAAAPSSMPAPIAPSRLADSLDNLSMFPQRQQALNQLRGGRHALSWPFSAQLTRLRHADQQRFVDAFEQQVVRDGLLRMVQTRVAAVANGGSDMLVAAYAQHLARRINLLDAALAGKPLDGLPQPGSELPTLVADFDPSAPFDPSLGERFRELYLCYLNAHPPLAALLRERTALREALSALALPNRSDHWLIAWADLQDSLQPVTAASLWDVPDDPQLPRLSAAYGAQGYQAISGFFDELQRASSAVDAAAFQATTLATHFQYTQRVAWYHFAQAFIASRGQLSGKAAWDHVLGNLLTPRDPYLRLIVGMSTALRHGAPNSTNQDADSAPTWTQLVDRLARLMPVTQPAPPGTGLAGRSLAWAQRVNSIGQAAVQSSDSVGGLWDAAGADFAVGQRLADYQAALYQALQALRGGTGAASALANKTLLAQTTGGDVTPLNTAARIFESIGNPAATQGAPMPEHTPAAIAAVSSATQRVDTLRARAATLTGTTGVRVPGSGFGGGVAAAMGKARRFSNITNAKNTRHPGSTSPRDDSDDNGDQGGAGDMGGAGDAEVAGVPDMSTKVSNNDAHSRDLDAPIRALARGALDFAADYAARAVSCKLQAQWDSNVLAPIAGMPDNAARMRLLFADKGLVASFTQSIAAPYLLREPSHYRALSVLAQPVPLTNPFLAFIGASADERMTAAARIQQQAALAASRASAEAAQRAELTTLQPQIDTLTSQAEQLATTHGAVEITAQPSKVNAGAREWPQQITLTLQCADARTTLQNLNFPSTTAFNWAPDRCGGVTLEARFANATLRHSWDGAHGFIDFLRASVDGHYRFDLTQMPDAPAALKAAQVKSVDVFWQQRGQTPLLDAYATLDKTRAQLQDLTARRDKVQALLNDAAAARAADAQRAALLGDANANSALPADTTDLAPLPPGVAPLPSSTSTADAGLPVPSRIGLCWNAARRAAGRGALMHARARAAARARALLPR